MTEKNLYHLVDKSLWLLVVSTGVFGLTTGAVLYMHGHGGSVMLMGLILMLGGMGVWFRDIGRESTLEGQHTSIVQVGLRMGMMLFIISEVMFFVSFFWGYFWMSVSLVLEIGSVWLLKGIEVINAWEILLLNTVILLSSGASVTWAHHSMIGGAKGETITAMLVTIGLAILFTILQGFEYVSGGFDISDGIYGSTFYMTTGFHGLHVILGTIMLILSTWRIKEDEVTRQHHFGFESSVWYWHFVDVVWLLLFVSIYWWGS